MKSRKICHTQSIAKDPVAGRKIEQTEHFKRGQVII
jgi:hypothetical protein